MSLSRRRFLNLSLGSGAALAASGFAWRGFSTLPVTRRAWALGSDVSMTVMGLPSGRAERAARRSFRRTRNYRAGDEPVSTGQSALSFESRPSARPTASVFDRGAHRFRSLRATQRRARSTSPCNRCGSYSPCVASRVGCRRMPRSPVPACASIGERLKSPSTASACMLPRLRSHSTGSHKASRPIGRSQLCAIMASHMRW